MFRSLFLRGRLRFQWWHDRLRLRFLRWLHPGLTIHPRAAPAFAHARLNLAPTARLRIDAGAVTERIPAALAIVVEAGAEVIIGEGCWLRTESDPVVLIAQPGARIEIGPHVLLNGCRLSAREKIVVHEKCILGAGVRVFDSQHDFDAEHPRRSAAVEIGPYSWLGADVVVLDGVTVGPHAVVGAKSLVTKNIPAHTKAVGVPARPSGPVGDRSEAG